jgi:meso-butanediol dehydrogenase / (S,S)-butanediol dehydrogenase / diacetyl reductase
MGNGTDRKKGDKVVLITGGGTGIGAACARRFRREGYRVAVVGRRRAAVEAVAQEVGGMAFGADAADTKQMAAVVEQILTRCGRLDALVACAGGLGMGSAQATSDADWQGALSANLSTAFVTSRACLAPLLKSRGAIVLVASIAGLAAGPEVCGYTASKHGLIGLGKSLARDYGAGGVRVNTLCPGWVRTPMADLEMAALMARDGIDLDAAYALVTRDTPLRRPASAEEIANACYFLASEQASIITGAVLVADGGAMIVDLPTLAFAS